MVEGYTHTEVGIIPNDWNDVPINQIFNFKQGVQCPVEKQYTTDTKGLKRFIRIIDLTNPSEPVRYIEDPGSAHHVKRDDLFMVRYGSPGLLGYRYEGVIANNLFRLLPKKDISNNFYFHYLTFIQDRILGISGSSTMPAINFSTLSSLPVVLPPTKAEQTAIATALNDADALITQLEKLIAKKRAIKQGAMQELLKPKDGWEVKKLGEVADVEKGEQLNRETLNEKDAYAVYNGGISPSGYTDKYNTEANSIIISEGGNSCGYVNFIRNRFWRGGHCYLVKTKQNLEYIFHLFKSLEKDIMGLRVGSGLPNIQRSRLLSFDICLPKDKSEQTRIAKILSDMDAEIEALEKKLDKYKMLKQGMMQNLLTGKIRLI